MAHRQRSEIDFTDTPREERSREDVQYRPQDYGTQGYQFGVLGQRQAEQNAQAGIASKPYTMPTGVQTPAEQPAAEAPAPTPTPAAPKPADLSAYAQPQTYDFHDGFVNIGALLAANGPYTPGMANMDQGLHDAYYGAGQPPAATQGPAPTPQATPPAATQPQAPAASPPQSVMAQQYQQQHAQPPGATAAQQGMSPQAASQGYSAGTYRPEREPRDDANQPHGRARNPDQQTADSQQAPRRQGDRPFASTLGSYY